MLIPIRTETPIRRTPRVNYALIAANVLLFFTLGMAAEGTQLHRFSDQYFALNSSSPALYQFVTYQFMHGDIMHLLGNMLFLWVFGNSVNAKMGDVAYLLFYLGAGIFSAAGYIMMSGGGYSLIGASGSISGVTTAYLALFPRSRIKVLLVFFLIQLFELPAMFMIILKIIVWDNIIAPGLGGPSNVAHSAHLAGYLYGFVVAMSMLALRGLPRDQFDMLALWKRYRQRREMRRAMADPAAAARAQYGSVANIPMARRATILPGGRTPPQQDKSAEMRQTIIDHIVSGNLTAAADIYQELLNLDADQTLPLNQQLALARHYYEQRKFAQAVAAFEKFARAYPHATETGEVRLLVGIIYARDLQRFEEADDQLTATMPRLMDQTRKDQCLHWLRQVRAALGRPAPDL